MHLCGFVQINTLASLVYYFERIHRKPLINQYRSTEAKFVENERYMC